MRPLTARGVLEAWERGDGQHHLEQALTLLATACPDLPRQQLETLTIGQRDGMLMRLREATLGSMLNAQSPCPSCGLSTNFSLDLHDIAEFDAPSGKQHEETIDCDGYRVSFRLPIAADLSAAAAGGTLEDARATLLSRCVLHAEHAGGPVDARTLPEAVVIAIGERMEQGDSLAEVPLVVSCQACGGEWMPILEMGAFLWREVSDLAERLMREVAELSRAYGWSEAEILAMGAARRRYYLELAG